MFGATTKTNYLLKKHNFNIVSTQRHTIDIILQYVNNLFLIKEKR